MDTTNPDPEAIPDKRSEISDTNNNKDCGKTSSLHSDDSLDFRRGELNSENEATEFNIVNNIQSENVFQNKTDNLNQSDGSVEPSDNILDDQIETEQNVSETASKYESASIDNDQSEVALENELNVVSIEKLQIDQSHKLSNSDDKEESVDDCNSGAGNKTDNDAPTNNDLNRHDNLSPNTEVNPENEQALTEDLAEVHEEDLGVYVDTDIESNHSNTEQLLDKTVISDKDINTPRKSPSRIQFLDPERTICNPEEYSERRVKVNTPVDRQQTESRTLESREATYQQAMTLLSTRCTSTQDNTYGHYVPEYFYVHQIKPRPMPPLKAWRGYHGNVYFEPIAINSLQQNLPIKTPVDKCSDRSHQLMVARSRITSRSSAKSRQISNQSRPFTQQQVILDKRSVLNRLDVSREDLVWLENQDSTGSLSIRPLTYGGKRRPISSGFDRIKKGSVSRALSQSAKYKTKADIKILGDRFVHPSALSPLLRSTTQYSLSNQRTQNSSPDLYHHGHHGNHDYLHPVEQVRVSLRHIDNSAENYGRMSSYAFNRSTKYPQVLKPFIKYSPEVRAKLGRKIITLKPKVTM